MPTHAAASWVLGRVIAITPEVCQVDAANERDLIVDHHDLLVVAMHSDVRCGQAQP